MLGLTKLEPGAGSVALSERPEREPGAGEVVLEVRAAGICGTDLHIEDGEFPSVPPVTMGHEVCGVVASRATVPSRVPPASSARPTSPPAARCGYCRAGRPNLCPERRSIGSHVDGALRAAPHRPARGTCTAIPDWLPDHAAPLAEPLACVCNSLFDPPVVGSRRRGARDRPGRRRPARRAGGARRRRRVSSSSAPSATAPASTLARAARVRGRDRRKCCVDTSPFDVVVECSGSAAGITTGLLAARRGGRFVQIGLRGAPVTVPFDEICYRELTVSVGQREHARVVAPCSRV